MPVTKSSWPERQEVLDWKAKKRAYGMSGAVWNQRDDLMEEKRANLRKKKIAALDRGVPIAQMKNIGKRGYDKDGKKNGVMFGDMTTFDFLAFLIIITFIVMFLGK